jgi:hypothetical protein
MEKRPGKGVGKVEEHTTNPFVRSIWAEEERIDVKGRSSSSAPMVVGGWAIDSGGNE